MSVLCSLRRASAAVLLAASADPSATQKLREMGHLTEQLAGAVNALIRFFYPLDTPSRRYICYARLRLCLPVMLAVVQKVVMKVVRHLRSEAT